VTRQRTSLGIFARHSPSWWERPSRKAGRELSSLLPICSHHSSLKVRRAGGLQDEQAFRFNELEGKDTPDHLFTVWMHSPATGKTY
jgi:hypothetical protein